MRWGVLIFTEMTIISTGIKLVEISAVNCCGYQCHNWSHCIDFIVVTFIHTDL
jgi:hypothetical protein